MCRKSVKLKQYCNESLLGKLYVCIAADVLKLLIYTSDYEHSELWNTPTDKALAAGRHTSTALQLCIFLQTMESLGGNMGFPYKMKPTATQAGPMALVPALKMTLFDVSKTHR